MYCFVKGRFLYFCWKQCSIFNALQFFEECVCGEIISAEENNTISNNILYSPLHSARLPHWPSSTTSSPKIPNIVFSFSFFLNIDVIDEISPYILKQSPRFYFPLTLDKLNAIILYFILLHSDLVHLSFILLLSQRNMPLDFMKN